MRQNTASKSLSLRRSIFNYGSLIIMGIVIAQSKTTYPIILHFLPFVYSFSGSPYLRQSHSGPPPPSAPPPSVEPLNKNTLQKNT